MTHRNPHKSHSVADPILLSGRTVVAYLRRRGLLDSDAATVRELRGGVSSVVLRVDSADRSVVVKQALPRLRVRAEWLAKRERTLSEAAALAVFHDITPNRVPQVIDVDRKIMALTMEAAPPDVGNWKEALLSDPRAAANEIPEILGRTLGRWHRFTRGRPEVLSNFQDHEAFDQLRLTPFHRELQKVHPNAASAIDAAISDLSSVRECLVHGDFSPKNVLVGGEKCWVVDAEVAKTGAPVFDVAFMTAHMMLKSVHLGHPPLLRDAASRFTDAYESEAGGGNGNVRLGLHVSVLLLARVDARSPADYLSPDEQRQLRAVVPPLLGDIDVSTADLWDALEREARW